MIELYNEDCMLTMSRYTDKHFDLAIVDPPYGETCVLTGGKAKANGYREYWNKVTDEGNWNIAPEDIYFQELFRVSNNLGR